MLKYEIKEKLRTSDYDMYDRVKIHSLFDIFKMWQEIMQQCLILAMKI